MIAGVLEDEMEEGRFNVATFYRRERGLSRGSVGKVSSLKFRFIYQTVYGMIKKTGAQLVPI